MPRLKSFTGVSFFRPGGKPTVSGGVLSEDSNYWYRTFFGSGTLTVTGAALSADVLIVAGGGGGGADGNGAGGGGGAGGLLGFTNQGFAPTSYTVTVGAGGAGGTTAGTTYGTQGGSSSITGLTTAVGGGYGSARSNAGSGGSGGGTGDGTNGTAWTAGSPTSGQGYAGSNSPLTNQGAGAGGGAGGAASAASGTSGGTGGVGSSAYSSWGLVVGVGQNVSGTVYFAGGGGGAAYNTSTYGSGGNGGGGRGGANGTAPIAGTVNTGGGGGGAGNQSGTISGGAGGSGVVIIRYPKALVDNITGAADFELIGTISLASAQSSVTFSGIPASLYKHLQVRMVAQTGTSGETILMQFNGDTASNYRSHRLVGTGAAVNVADYGSQTKLLVCADIPTTTSSYAGAVIDIMDAFSTSKNKTLKSATGFVGSATTVFLLGGVWLSNSAISSMTLYASAGVINANSRFSLYGIRG